MRGTSPTDEHAARLVTRSAVHRRRPGNGAPSRCSGHGEVAVMPGATGQANGRGQPECVPACMASQNAVVSRAPRASVAPQ